MRVCLSVRLSVNTITPELLEVHYDEIFMASSWLKGRTSSKMIIIIGMCGWLLNVTDVLAEIDARRIS